MIMGSFGRYPVETTHDHERRPAWGGAGWNCPSRWLAERGYWDWCGW